MPGRFNMSVTSVCAVFIAIACSTECAATTTNILYKFQGLPNDGVGPIGGLVADSAGSLYGVTEQGGTGQCSGPNGVVGCGIIFKLSQSGNSWKETILYNLQPGGGFPAAALIAGPDGSLYGTAIGGGGNGDKGDVFRLTPPNGGNGSWVYTQIYAFTGGMDGGAPYGKLLLDAAGALYGTASAGGYTGGAPCGNVGCGSVFMLTAPKSGNGAWTEATLYAFKGGTNDGVYPTGGLLADASGTLYGTTNQGGKNSVGTAFALTPPTKGGREWTEKILHDFSVTGQGDSPYGGFIADTLGNIYATTYQCCGIKWGTVFELSPPAKGKTNWLYTPLYTLPYSGQRGEYLAYDLVSDAHGSFYATAYLGGTGHHGVVFKVAPPSKGSTKWTQTVLHDFTGAGGDGSNPLTTLTFGTDGALYGVTSSGGMNYGTVFQTIP